MRRRSPPAASYTGPDDFLFTASDGTATSPPYSFHLIIIERGQHGESG